MSEVKRRYELSDEEWSRIETLLPPDNLKHQGRPPKSNRMIINGILWVAKSGAAWRDLPERYGPWQTVYSRFRKWSEEGVFEAVFVALGMDADYQDLSIDSTMVKVHQSAAGAKKGPPEAKKADRKSASAEAGKPPKFTQ